MFLQCSAGIYLRKCSLLFNAKMCQHILTNHIGRDVIPFYFFCSSLSSLDEAVVLAWCGLETTLPPRRERDWEVKEFFESNILNNVSAVQRRHLLAQTFSSL